VESPGHDELLLTQCKQLVSAQLLRSRKNDWTVLAALAKWGLG
jgi:hypothetical protein